MEIYLLKLVSNWLSVLCVSLISLFGTSNFYESSKGLENTSYTKTVSVVSEVIPYDTKIVYNSKKSSDSEDLVLVEGVEGLSYTYENGTTKVLRKPITKVIEKGTARKGSYVGRLTVYGADCPGCSKNGYVACRTKAGKKWSLTKDGIYYPDSEYGDVRILAAALKGFPCGTIIKVDNGKVKPYYAVVLDTGGSMRKAYANGNIWFDLAFVSQKNIKGANVSGKNVKFDVQRWGW